MQLITLHIFASRWPNHIKSLMSHPSVAGIKVPSSKDTPAGILDRPFGHVHSSRLLVGITNAGLLCISDEGKLNNNLECHCARA